jgi:methylisocitrate lyase
MARTDLRATDGLPAAIDRMRALVDAGADAIFPEALRDLGEFEQVCAALDVPVLANMTEFGRSALFTREQLAATGVAMVIYPVTLLRAAMGAAERVLDTILEEGTQESRVPEMLTRARLYELVDYESYSRFDASVFDFEVPAAHVPARTQHPAQTPPSTQE